MLSIPTAWVITVFFIMLNFNYFIINYSATLGPARLTGLTGKLSQQGGTIVFWEKKNNKIACNG